MACPDRRFLAFMTGKPQVRFRKRFAIPEKAQMSTLQAIALGMMVSWTPCVVVVAYFLWKAPIQD
jgi:hypothetical protein